MILITGGDGQLAREFSRFFELRGEKFLAPKRCELDIVNLTLRVLKMKKYGIYHISGGGEASRYEQGRYILEKLGYSGEIHEGRTLDFTPYDIRPKYSKLSSSKIEELLDIKIPGWKERIDQYLY